MPFYNKKYFFLPYIAFWAKAYIQNLFYRARVFKLDKGSELAVMKFTK